MDGRRADQRRVGCAAAGHELHPIHARQGSGHVRQLVGPDRSPRVEPAGQALPECLRLLVDLLEHEVGEAALLGGLRRPVHARHEPLARGPVDGRDRGARRAKVDDVPILEEDHPVRVRQDRGDVGGEERLAVTEPHHERDVLPRAHQPVRLTAMHDRHRVGALDLRKRRTNGVGQVAGVRVLDQVREGLRVGVGAEHVPARLEAVAQLAEVLDDAVVDHGDGAGAVDVRVGVQVVRAAVRRPARVGEPDPRVRRPVQERRRKVGQLPRPLLDEELARLGDERDPGRVVAAILQAPEPLEENGSRRPGTRVPNDAAHAVESLRRANRISMAAGLV